MWWEVERRSRMDMLEEPDSSKKVVFCPPAFLTNDRVLVFALLKK